MQAAKLLVFLSLSVTVVRGSPNLPIWGMLNHQEKMSRLMYVFNQLVNSYCTGSIIPDCNKVLTLYGMSNLVNVDENALNIMDPYQQNSRTIIWEKVMKEDFKLRTSKNIDSNSIVKEVETVKVYDYINEVDDSPSTYLFNQRINKLSNDPHPYAVRVPAPDKIVAAHATRNSAYNLVTSDFDKMENNKIDSSSTDAENVSSNTPKRTLDLTEGNRTDKSEIAVGSSHPYAVKILPESPMPEDITADNNSASDYEPIMVEPQVRDVQALPPTLIILKGK